MLNNHIEFDDEIFFLSVELFNKYLIDSRIKVRFQFFFSKYSSIDPIRLIEYFDELARIDTNLNGFRHKLTRDHFTEIQMEILLTIDFQFPRYTPHLFISYFIRFLSSFRFFFRPMSHEND